MFIVINAGTNGRVTLILLHFVLCFLCYSALHDICYGHPME